MAAAGSPPLAGTPRKEGPHLRGCLVRRLQIVEFNMRKRHSEKTEHQSRMTMRVPKRLANRRGYTMIEAMATIAITGVLIGSALPHVDTRRQEINSAVNAVVADLRFARGRSITTGTHYAFVLTDSGTYEVQRLKENAAGDWVLDQVAKTNHLPEQITLAFSQPASVEFNTRGMMISAPSILTLDFSDTTFGATHQVSIWPSGQIHHEL
jgi:prepilin-type N-terminal cleavage/methylation domain-containing protein